MHSLTVLEARGPGTARPSLLRVPQGRKTRCRPHCVLTWGSEGICFQTHSGWLLNSVPCDCAAGSRFLAGRPILSLGEASSLDALPHPESHLPGGAQALLRAHLIGSRPQVSHLIYR